MNTLQKKIAINNSRKLKIQTAFYILAGIGAFLLMAWGEGHL